MRNNSTWAPSALSPISWAPEAWNPWLTLFAIFGAIVAAFVPQLVYAIVAVSLNLIDVHHPNAVGPDQLLALQAVTYIPLGIYLLIVLPVLAHSSLAALGLRWPSAGELLAGILGALAMTLAVDVAGAIMESLTHKVSPEAAITLLHEMKTPQEKIGFFLIACLLAPMIEELGFRVLLYNALTRYIPIPAAIVVSGFVFGTVHMSPLSLDQLLTVAIPLACGGMVLAYVYAATRCYWSNVTTHALFNGISVAAVFLFHAK